MDDHEMTFYLLFGVVVAIMLAGVFVMQLQAQTEAAVDMQAQDLVDDLARATFTTFAREQQSFDLPMQVGGSEYELKVDEERAAFIVHIVKGSREGDTYIAIANVKLRVENSAFSAGENIYFLNSGGEMIVSASSIVLQHENVQVRPTTAPPELYFFAKENQRIAAAIVSAYFEALENFSASGGTKPLDILGYKLEGENILVQLRYRGGDDNVDIRVIGYENQTNVGKVDNAWIVVGYENENMSDPIPCPSVENAVASGWLLSPSQALSEFRSRTWCDNENNIIIPENVRCYAAVATTNVGIYPTWRFEFLAGAKKIVVHYRMFYWAPEENTPGFVFQSEPKLESVI